MQDYVIIGLQSEKIIKFWGCTLASKDLTSLLVVSLLELLCSHFLFNPTHLFFNHSIKKLSVHFLSDSIPIQFHFILEPLPVLHPADLSSRSIFHQVVKRHATASTQPCCQVLNPHPCV
ncbi:hypothetical protein V8G54_016563 [Vigna mungo]|uniref:Uncharacterized protein n=1 Tax=Vigna mungo TaxID=3915 RepID=A0AAQ3S0K1_VIGMU